MGEVREEEGDGDRSSSFMAPRQLEALRPQKAGWRAEREERERDRTMSGHAAHGAVEGVRG